MNRTFTLEARESKQRWSSSLVVLTTVICSAVSVLSVSCGKNTEAQAADSGPHHAVVEPDIDANNFKVDHPEQFSLAVAGAYQASTDLNVTGIVSPDISRQVPVISLASGRVVEIDAKLGDLVKKGQLLFKVRSPDIAQAFSDYQKAVKNEELTKVQLDRAAILYEKGAIPKSALEVAQNAEDDAKVDVDTTTEHLRVLGSTLDHPTGVVPIYAPVTGVITDQQITNASGVQALSSLNPFTISDMSHVWIICDVYENNLAQVHLNEYADIRLNAYPDRLFKARIANIGEIWTPRFTPPRSGWNWRMDRSCGWECLSPQFSMAKRKRPMRQCPRRQFSTCTTVIGSTLPTDLTPLSESRSEAERCFPATFKRSYTGINPGAKVVNNALVLQNTSGAVMIRSIVDYALNNRLMVIAVALLLFVWGAMSFHQLPVEAFPDVADNYVEIIARSLGISAEQVF